MIAAIPDEKFWAAVEATEVSLLNEEEALALGQMLRSKPFLKAARGIYERVEEERNALVGVDLTEPKGVAEAMKKQQACKAMFHVFSVLLQQSAEKLPDPNPEETKDGDQP